MSWTFGIHAVESILSDEADRVQEVWFVRSKRPGPARSRLRERVQEIGVRFRMVDDDQMRRALGDVSHQGVAARVTEYDYAEVSSLLKDDGPRCIVALDGVTDPHNLGAVIRSTAALGACGVVIPRHRSASVTATVSKVAVGAENLVGVAQVVNLGRFLEDAKEAGFWVYGAAGVTGTRITDVDLAERAVLVMGSEGRGIRQGVMSKCDVQVSVPIEKVESLNVSVATSILLWEWARSHGRKSGAENG